MHELSIAMSLVDIAVQEASARGAKRITELHLRVGPLSGVATDALEFSFGLAAEGTLVAGARLAVQSTPIVAWCDACRAEQTIATAQCLRCPVCGELTPQLLRGRELELVALALDDGDDDGDDDAGGDANEEGRS